MISFFGNYYGDFVVKNIEKVFYMICGVALVFAGIIGGLIENDANAQTAPNPEYKVVKEEFPNLNMRVQKSINEGCEGGEDTEYAFHQMVVTSWTSNDVASTAMLIFKKK